MSNGTGCPLAPDASFEERFVPNYDDLAELVKAFKLIGFVVVLVQGVYDLLHVGHCRYLCEAKKKGGTRCIVIVGVDTDELTRDRKGNNRPIVPEAERLEMLYHLRYVDILTLRRLGQDTNELIRIVRPDVLITSESTKDFATDKAMLKDFCGEIVTLPPQAETSTTARIRNVEIAGASEVLKKTGAEMDQMIGDLQTMRGRFDTILLSIKKEGGEK